MISFNGFVEDPMFMGRHKFTFVNAHMDLIQACFSPVERKGYRLDETPQAKKLIALARAELRYSKDYSDIDVFMGVVHCWLDIRKAEAVKRTEKLRMAAEPKPPEYGGSG